MSTMSNISQLFAHVPDLQPSPELEGVILRAVDALEESRVRRARLWSYAGFFSSTVALLYAGFEFGGSLIRSEFWTIVHLIFSDMQVVVANWNQFVYSVLETFPVVSILALLIPVALLLWSFSSWASLHQKTHHRYAFN